MRVGYLAGLCLAVLAAAFPVWAFEESSAAVRERELMERVQALEQRIAELEERPVAPPAATPAEAPSVEQEREADTDFRAYWKDGLRFETRDKRFALGVGGRIHCDWAFFDQDDELKWAVGDEDDGTEFRRAWIQFRGTLYDSIQFKAEYDFAGNNGDAKFKDVYIGVEDLPWVGNVKVGHFREPFGFEQLTSANYLTFMERALPDVLTPGRNMGLLSYDSPLNKRLTWAIGAFKGVDDFPSDDDSDEDQGYAVTARVTGLPWYADEGRRWLHLGVAYSRRNPDGAVLGWKARPEAHLANRYVNTEGIAGYRLADARMDDVAEWGMEAALTCGPFSVQGEYMLAEVDTDSAGRRAFDGYYVQAGYFLTGECRPYTPASGLVGRVRPRRNFSLGEERGWGAWEVALRYSELDLDDGPIRGGVEENYTFGLNWYLNANTRVMWNYVLANIEHDLYDGDLQVFQTRFQVDF